MDTRLIAIEIINEKRDELIELMTELLEARMASQARHYVSTSMSIFLDIETKEFSSYEHVGQIVGSTKDIVYITDIDDHIASFYGQDCYFSDYLRAFDIVDFDEELSEEELENLYEEDFEEFIKEGVRTIVTEVDFDALVDEILEELEP